MLIKNISKKSIGFGRLVVAPDETVKLPKGFDRNHPVVSWYIKQGFIAEVNSLPDIPDTAQVPVNEPGGGTEKPPETVQVDVSIEKPLDDDKKRNKKVTD